jgi:uncharacterized protein (TIGR00251 family)
MNEVRSRLTLKVIPNAVKSEVVAFNDGVLKIKVAAPPVKGRANQVIINFMSQLLAVPKSSLLILKGHQSRNKILHISGMTAQELLEQLSDYLIG